jgi:BspA type Leucine rich repeat region (6 copies)
VTPAKSTLCSDHVLKRCLETRERLPLGLSQVSTLPATAVSTNSAALNGSVSPNGWPTIAWFQWGATSSYGNVTSATALGSGTTALPLSAPLAGLTLGVTYHFRVAATNDYGLAYGSDQSFTTATLTSEFNYTTNNGTITITGYTGPGGDVTIPDTISGQAVTSIGDYAFWGQTLTSVTIPNSVTSIGHQAFLFCGRLTSASLGNGVTSIGYEPFGDCTNLTSLTVDPLNSAYSSVEGVLFNKTQTTLVQYLPGVAAASYTIPNGVTSVEDRAFEFCQRLTKITIPDGVTSIGDWAFAECTSLTGVYFEGNAPGLGGSYVFQDDNQATVYYLHGTTGWGTTFDGLPTALWQQGAPEASTVSASSITTNSATLHSTVNPNGWATIAWFQWGATTYDNLTPVTALSSGTTALSLSAPLAGLTLIPSGYSRSSAKDRKAQWTFVGMSLQ